MPTSNPVPSQAPSDLLFNAEKLDQFVSGSALSYTDRLGVSRRSLAGIDAAADNVLNSIGYAVPVAYASGISLTLTSQTVEYNGAVYAPKSSELPFTTSSWGNDSAKFRAIQFTDADLITYMPAGTGAVATTVQDALRKFVSVKNFGADPSASASANTVAISAALIHAGTKKCSVYVPGEAAAYQVNDEFTVPDGVTVFGDGYGSFIQQTALNKGGFILGNNSTVRDLRIKVADGDNTAFVNCVYANSVNNPTIKDNWLEPGDLGGCGVHVRKCNQTVIKGNRIYGGKWSSGASFAASAADILFYSAGASERHIIEGNFCLSNNSQGIFIDALGYEGDIIVSNNICVTLDPTTCTETGTWSLAASGGVRRHGILVGYNSSNVNGQRCVIDGNICRNTKWTGIYKQGSSAGPVIISNNVCDLNGYETTNSLSGGIYISQAGFEEVTGNSISRFQNTIQGTGAITVNSPSVPSAPTAIRGNKIKASANVGIALTTFCAGVEVAGNTLSDNVGADIFYIATSGNAGVGGHRIIDNTIMRPTGSTSSGIYLDLQSSTKYTTVANNRVIGGDNTTANQFNAGIHYRQASEYVRIQNNEISNFYYGVYCSAYFTGGRMATVIIEGNTIESTNTGFALSSTTGNNTVPVVNSKFINVTNKTSAPIGSAVARIVQRLGDRLQWETTAAPTTGSWAIGDRSANSTPAVGQPKGWVCTVAGAPGTWVSEGNL